MHLRFWRESVPDLQTGKFTEQFALALNEILDSHITQNDKKSYKAAEERRRDVV